MKKSLWLMCLAIIMATGCSKKEEAPAPKEPAVEAAPMSAEPADPSTTTEDATTTQDPVVLEPIEGESGDAGAAVGDAQNGEIAESVDDETPSDK